MLRRLLFAASMIALLSTPFLIAQDRDMGAERMVLDDDGNDGTLHTLTIDPGNLGQNTTLIIPDPGTPTATMLFIGGGGSSSVAWLLGGNSNATTPGDFLGTTNANPMRILVNSGADNSLILNTNGSIQRDAGGNPRGPNAIDLQIDRAAVQQVASGLNSVVGGGRGNRATASHAAVASGQSNVASGDFSIVAGGETNRASGPESFVGGGSNNTASAGNATVAGGNLNQATSPYSIVSGGRNNVVAGSYATIAGGRNNLAPNDYATVGGGFGNAASGTEAAVGGGNGNNAQGDRATIGGGNGNAALGTEAVIGGGAGNSVSADYTTIGGGVANNVSGIEATVGGGSFNSASGLQSTVGGGRNNDAQGIRSTIGGGIDNRTFDANSTVGGGFGNTARADGTVAGGRNNLAVTYAAVGGGAGNSPEYGGVVGGGFSNTTGVSSAIPGGRGLTVRDRSFGFLANTSTPPFQTGPGNRPMEIQVGIHDIAVFGNADLWLANNNNDASQIRFYEANATTGAFPNGTNYTSFEAGAQTANINYILPTVAPTAGQVLQSDASGNLSWAVAGSGGAAFNRVRIDNTDSPYAPNPVSCVIGVDVSTAAVTINLPDADQYANGEILIINVEEGNAGTNNVTINASAGDTFDGAAGPTTLTITFGQGQFRMYSDGANGWYTY